MGILNSSEGVSMSGGLVMFGVGGYSKGGLGTHPPGLMPLVKQTHACENVTFLQLLLRVVTNLRVIREELLN